MSSTVKEITLLEVKKHNTPEDLWMVIHNKVYDLTKFRSEHPGGDDVLDEWAGKEASKAFDDVGHSSDAVEMMEQYCVGDLAEADRKSSSPCKKHCCGIAIAALLAGVAVAFVIKRALKN